MLAEHAGVYWWLLHKFKFTETSHGWEDIEDSSNKEGFLQNSLIISSIVVFYDVFGQKIVNLKHSYQGSCQNYCISIGWNLFRSRRSCGPSPYEEYTVDYETNYPKSHCLFSKMFYSENNYQHYEKNCSKRTNPTRSISNNSLNLKADKVEVQKD